MGSNGSFTIAMIDYNCQRLKAEFWSSKTMSGWSCAETGGPGNQHTRSLQWMWQGDCILLVEAGWTMLCKVLAITEATMCLCTLRGHLLPSVTWHRPVWQSGLVLLRKIRCRPIETSDPRRAFLQGDAPWFWTNVTRYIYIYFFFRAGGEKQTQPCGKTKHGPIASGYGAEGVPWYLRTWACCWQCMLPSSSFSLDFWTSSTSTTDNSKSWRDWAGI